MHIKVSLILVFREQCLRMILISILEVYCILEGVEFKIVETRKEELEE